MEPKEIWVDKYDLEVLQNVKTWADVSAISCVPDDKSENVKYTRAPEWVSVADRLPNERTPVLILTSYGKMATVIYVAGIWHDWMRFEHSYGDVTHWQPPPPLPEDITND